MTNTQAATLMIQGTTSDAGKSVLVAGFCRCLKRLGYQVAPFKPQNMALNSAVTADGGEIGRAQALQAQAAGVAPHVDMNPILLKPSSDTGAQVIIHGKAISNMQAQAYHDYKKIAMQAVLDSHLRLSKQYQVVMVEGAGSPAEINLREGDIANMGFAEAVDCPVIIVADIDKGGVFAHLVGTLDLLSPSEQNRVVGFVINKFRGDIALLQSGLDWLEQRTHKPVLGVLPYLMDLQLAEEDAIQANQTIDQDDIRLRIAVPVFSRISNHTDFDMLRAHPQIELTFVRQGQKIPAADLIILPGSKHVRADIELLRKHSWDKDIAKHLRYGGKVLGICGGYQMLGQIIHDPTGIEGTIGSSKGLGYLPINTTLQIEKQLTLSQGRLILQADLHNNDIEVLISGYQIHVGHTEREAGFNAFALLDDGQLGKGQLNDKQLEKGHLEGCVSADNQVAGSYLHGMFDSPEALQQIISWAGAHTDEADSYVSQQEHELDRLADACMAHLDWEKIHTFITEQTYIHTNKQTNKQRVNTMTDEKDNDRHKTRMQEQKAKVDERIAAAQEDKGLLLVLTGNGKGKSTSGFGTVARAVGHGLKASVVQYVKGGWECGERNLLEKNGVEFHVMGTGFTWETQDKDTDKIAAQAAWEHSKKLLQDPAIDVVLLDEITYMITYKYIDLDEVMAALIARPKDQHVVITGRACHRSIIEMADTVSEVRPVKHAFDNGIKAQQGIDW